MHRHRRKHAKTLNSLIRSLLTLTLLALFVAPAFAAPGAPASLPCAQVLRDAAGWPATLRGCQFEATDEGNSAEAQARAFLRDYRTAFGLDATLSTLSLISARHALGSSHVVFQQTLAGHPVYGAYLSVHLDGAGEIQVIHSRTLPDLRLARTVASLSAVEAVQRARAAIQFGAPRANNPAPELVVLPAAGDVGRLVWRVMISAAEPQGDWEVLVDATSGEVIKRYNRLVLARGRVFDTAAAQPGSRPAGDLPPLRTLTLQGLDDSGWLRGQYVDVTGPAGYQPATAFSVDGNFQYDPEDPRLQEVMVYYYIDSTQRYLQTLGYSDRNDPPNGIRDRVTYASPHWFAQDQSFYSASDDALHFGDGGWPDANDPDIIVHEYGHALLHDLTPIWGGGEMEAIGEGFGDYLAASRFAESSADPACIGEWDSRAYVSDPPYCLRRVDRDRQYPVDVSGDAHADGEIWSRVLWDVRSALGPKVADVLALESNFYLPPAASLVEAGQALLDADASLYDGRYQLAIKQALQARGLAPLPAPVMTSPISGETLLPGSLRTIAWQVETSLPVSYEVEWSANAAAVGTRSFDFGGDRLSQAFGAQGASAWQLENGAVRSGRLEHGQSSRLVLPVETVASGELSFRYRIDTEPGYDRFEFLIDGQVALHASGQQDWVMWSTTLSAGQHELVWRYAKDSTLSSGEDAVWIDDVRVEAASLADWHAAELASGRPANGDALWRIPRSPSAAAGLRVRTRVGAVVSPWHTRTGLIIDAPTAVSLVGFEAGAGELLARRLTLLPWGAAGLAGALILGVGLGEWVTRRRDRV